MKQLNRIKISIGRTKENSKVVVRADWQKCLFGVSLVYKLIAARP